MGFGLATFRIISWLLPHDLCLVAILNFKEVLANPSTSANAASPPLLWPVLEQACIGLHQHFQEVGVGGNLISKPKIIAIVWVKTNNFNRVHYKAMC